MLGNQAWKSSMVYFELLSLYTRVRALVLNSCSIHLHKNSKFIGYSLASYKSLNQNSVVNSGFVTDTLPII